MKPALLLLLSLTPLCAGCVVGTVLSAEKSAPSGSVDPSGLASLRFFQAAHPLDPGLLFRRPDCGRFELSLDRNDLSINDVYDLHISLDFECHAASGESATGHLAADHCH